MSEVAPAVTSNQKGDAPLNGTNDEAPEFGVEKMHRNSSVDVFRTCADPGQTYAVNQCTLHWSYTEHL